MPYPAAAVCCCRRLLALVPTPLLHAVINETLDGDLVLVHLQEENLIKVSGVSLGVSLGYRTAGRVHQLSRACVMRGGGILRWHASATLVRCSCPAHALQAGGDWRHAFFMPAPCDASVGEAQIHHCFLDFYTAGCVARACSWRQAVLQMAQLP